ncbi:MAG: thioredoxin [Bdellovibrionaceae bacterium]|nr:thioredoxin [Pseudobdellovibrionaceae bacterium]|tara:strand:+ start:724 stop:1056 length:333 start_codon:yes stop_codon:yes gene_type:complete
MADSKNVSVISDSTFEDEIMKSDQLTLVDFWAEWCGPCRMLSPTVEAIADEYAGKVKVAKMNVDENPSTPGRFSVRGIPTLLFVKNGEVVETLVGNQPKEVITDTLNRHL